MMLVWGTPGATGGELFTLGGSVNINTAGIEDLEKLPFIGVQRAKKIIAHREKFGFFKGPGDITSVDGISTDIFSSVKGYLSVTGKTDLKFSPYKGLSQPFVNISSFDGPVLALDNEKYFFMLNDKIAAAKKTILLSMYLFKTSKFKNNRANRILAGLLEAAGRGVEVVAVLEESDYKEDRINISNRQTARKLRRGGAKVFFDGKKKITHTKLIIIDERYLFLGSHNLTHTALTRSNETSLMVDSPELARYFKLYLENL